MKKIVSLFWGNDFETKRKSLQTSLWVLDALVFIGIGMISVIKREFDTALWWFTMLVLVVSIYTRLLSKAMYDTREGR